MTLKFQTQNQTLIISPDGELDHHNAIGMREQINDKFSSSHARNIVFNMQKLRFMDSSGLGILIGRYKAVSSIGGKISIVKPTETVQQLISLAGIHKIIPIYNTLDEALGGVI